MLIDVLKTLAPELKVLGYRKSGGWFGVLAFTSMTMACGSKTGLRVPCEIELAHNSTDVVLVLDHSGSMDIPLGGGRTPWSVLTDTLGQSLPAFDDAMSVGLMTFPIRPAFQTVADYCAVSASLDVGVQPRGVTASLGALAMAGLPLGETPTFDALRAAADALRARRRDGTSQFIVLGTDGWPNCNTTFTRATCDCPTSFAECFSSGVSDGCLDTARVVDEIATLARENIRTFVIGIEFDGDPIPFLQQSLDSMALAGEESLPTGAHHYLRGTDAATLRDAFESALGPLAFCHLTALSPHIDLHHAGLSVQGAAIPQRDTSHVNGWDWIDIERGELEIFGDACAAIVRARARVSMVTDVPLCP